MSAKVNERPVIPGIRKSDKLIGSTVIYAEW